MTVDTNKIAQLMKTTKVNTHRLNAKDYAVLEKSFSAAVKEAYGLNKAPKPKNFGINMLEGTLVATVTVPVTIKVALSEIHTEASEEEQTDNTEAETETTD